MTNIFHSWILTCCRSPIFLLNVSRRAAISLWYWSLKRRGSPASRPARLSNAFLASCTHSECQFSFMFSSLTRWHLYFFMILNKGSCWLLFDTTITDKILYMKYRTITWLLHYFYRSPTQRGMLQDLSSQWYFGFGMQQKVVRNCIYSCLYIK